MKGNWENCIQEDRVNLVFIDRNQAFGAYVIRREYGRTVISMFLLASFGLILLIGLPALVAHFTGTNVLNSTGSETVIDLLPPPPAEKIEPLPPAEKPKVPLSKTTAFTPPVVVKNPDAPTDLPPSQDTFQNADAGSVTQPGTTDIIDLPIDNQGTGNVTPTIPFIVEEMPSFPGGDLAMMKFLRDNMRYPAKARENNITGKVYVTFVIDKEGHVIDAKVLAGIGGGCDEEALRVVNSMPRWRPGRQQGEAVMVQFNLPIGFTLK